MTRKKNFICVILLVALLQITFLHYFRVFGAKPDLFLICVVIASLYFEVEYALLLSLLCGILKDIFSAVPFGVNTFFLPVFSFLTMKLSRKTALDNTLVLCAAVFLITFSYDIVNRLVLGLSGFVIPVWMFLRISLVESFYTALIFPLVLRLLKKARVF